MLRTLALAVLLMATSATAVQGAESAALAASSPATAAPEREAASIDLRVSSALAWAQPSLRGAVSSGNKRRQMAAAAGARQPATQRRGVLGQLGRLASDRDRTALAYPLSDRLSLDLGYRFLEAEDMVVRRVEPGTSRSHLQQPSSGSPRPLAVLSALHPANGPRGRSGAERARRSDARPTLRDFRQTNKRHRAPGKKLARRNPARATWGAGLEFALSIDEARADRENCCAMAYYDVIVIGGGHAGCEAAAAARAAGRAHAAADPQARHHRRDVVQPRDRRARQGPPGARDRCARRLMGRATDRAGIQFRMLNRARARRCAARAPRPTASSTAQAMQAAARRAAEPDDRRGARSRTW